MKLVNSIVVMKHQEHERQVIDTVLLVKHPEGINPVPLIQSALGGSHDISHIDWSLYFMHIQEADSWSVIDLSKSAVRNQVADPKLQSLAFHKWAIV